MSELSPSAAALVRAGRGGLRPSPGDEARIAEVLRARLGPAVLPPDGAIGAGPAAHSAWMKLLAVAGAAGTIAGAAALLAWQPPAASAPKPEAPVRAALAVPARAEASLSSASAPVEQVSNSAPPEASVVSARRAHDHLAQEVAILSRATSDLHAGRPASALKSLAEHQRKFPKGLLSQERQAARAQALCALGRTRDAELELGRLTKSSPQSPNAARAREVCRNSGRVK
jgi:hypothetical protein